MQTILCELMTRLELRKASSSACKENKNQNTLTSPDTLTSLCPCHILLQVKVTKRQMFCLYTRLHQDAQCLTLFIPKFHKLCLFQEFYLLQVHLILSIDTFFHCLPTENAPLFLPTYPHKNYTVGVNILIPFPFTLTVVVSIF